MKNIKTRLLGLSLVVVGSMAYSQVVIGGKKGSAEERSLSTASVLLDFPMNKNKGIILPYVTTLPSSPTPGTIILDSTDPLKARVKYYNENTTSGSAGWTDLSGQDGTVSTELIFQNLFSTREVDSKAIIGSATTSADGVLVLESTTKAMVLPIVEDVNLIPSPSPGMMVYVNKTGAKRLAVFNGSKWSFWKP